MAYVQTKIHSLHWVKSSYKAIGKRDYKTIKTKRYFTKEIPMLSIYLE